MAIDQTRQSQHNAVQLAYYEDRTFEENRRVSVQSTPYIQNHIAKFLSFAQLENGAKILDVGCGMGKYTLPLAELGHTMEGLDLSSKLLGELAHQTSNKTKIPLHCSDILNPEKALLGQYDIVVGFFMLHHLIDVGEAWKQMKRLLKPGGRVVFLDVNPMCPLYYLQITLSPSMSWSAEKGIVNLHRKKIESVAKMAGFKNLKIEKFGILPPALRNLRGGKSVETAFESLPFINGISAFQLISAKL